MSQERVEAYAEAVLGIARAEGRVDEIERELFQFARAVEGNDALRSAITDPALPAERRYAVVAEIMGAKALAPSTALAAAVVAAGRGSDLTAIVDRFVELDERRRPARVVVRPRRSRSVVSMGNNRDRVVEHRPRYGTGIDERALARHDPRRQAALTGRLTAGPSGSTVRDHGDREIHSRGNLCRGLRTIAELLPRPARLPRGARAHGHFRVGPGLRGQIPGLR